jgi:PAS domain S-box-containing protein
MTMNWLLPYLQGGEIKRGIGIDRFIFSIGIFCALVELVLALGEEVHFPAVMVSLLVVAALAAAFLAMTFLSAVWRDKSARLSAILITCFVAHLALANHYYHFRLDQAVLLYFVIPSGAIFFSSPRLLLSYLAITLGLVGTTVLSSELPLEEKAHLFSILIYELPVAWALFAINYRIGMKLEAANAHYRLVTDFSSDLIATHRLDGTITYVSPSVHRMLGYTPEEVLGTSAFRIISKLDRDRVIDLYRVGIVQRQETTKMEYRLQRKDGTLLWVEAAGTPVKDAHGRIVQTLTTSRDISLRKESERERELYNDELLRINRELDQFAYVVSHDLKAPLRGISTLSDFIEEDMADQPVSPEVRRHLSLMRERVLRLERMINDILEYSRAGRSVLQRTQTDVRALLRDVVELLNLPAAFPVVLQGQFPVMPVAQVLMEQVFSNLINNARVHHDKPSGTITITGAAAEGGWNFTVEDDGPGIAPEFHERIFEVFQQLHGRNAAQGTGIGLAIVRKIIEKEGGTIKVDAAIGKGTRFLLFWPIDEWQSPI